MHGKVSLLAMALIGTTAPAQAAGRVQFFCTVSGAGMIKPHLPSDDICARFRRRIEAVVKMPLLPVASLPQSPPATTRWIKLAISFRKPGVAAAMMTQFSSGKMNAYPELAISVSDRSMDSGTIDMLVREVARTLRF